MSDDEDYMSNKFLTACASASSNEIQRPGIAKSLSEKRNLQIFKRKLEQDEINRKKNPNIRVLESERRKEGLEKPIDQSNKGFALLEKMGYKAGMSIGKRGSGLLQPVPIQLKTDREGLGRAEEKREKYKSECKKITEKQVSVNEYRSRITEKVAQRQIENDFRKSQRICERLDSDNGIEQPLQSWYWFTSSNANTDILDEDNMETMQERLEAPTETDHNYESDSESSEYEDENVEEAVPVEDKLLELTCYLREKYFYCIWCGVKFNDEDDIKKECPGNSRQDH